MRTTLLFLFTLTFAQAALASPTKHWKLESYRSFRGGKSTGALLPSSGGVLPGLRATKAKSKDGMPGLFHTMTKVGGTLYLGSGDPAAVWTLKGNTLKKMATLKGEIVVTKILKAARGGGVLVATLPNGKIYRVTQGKKPELVVTLKADHIWDMIYVGTNLYAATGPKAKLFKVNVAGKKAEEIWSVKETHLLSLALSKGKLLVGTAPEARLYQVDPRTKKGTLLYDFPGNEVREIIAAPDAIYAATNNLSYRAQTSYSTRRLRRRSRSANPRAILSAKPGKTYSRRKVVRGSGAVFTLDSSGVAEPIFSLSSGYFTSMQLQGKRLYCADGQSGRIYRFDTEDFSGAVLMQSEERQVLDFILEKEKRGFAATGDGAALYTLSRTRGKAVSYESVVLDAGRAATFGNILMEVTGGKVKLETRSGVTPSADDKIWNPWRTIGQVRTLPSGLKQAVIKSKGARYLQFKVSWPAGSSAKLKSLELFFIPTNTKPRMGTINVTTESSSRSYGAKPVTDSVIPSRLRMRNGNVRFSWGVLNRDGDTLVYKLWIKKAGDKLWRRLSPKKPITSRSYTWAAAFEPEGVYVAKVEVCDSPSNAPGSELRSSKISAPFVVDNRAPNLTGLSVRGGVVRFSARDKFSRIVGAAYRVGAGRWKMVLPKDGMFDSLSESFQFKLPAKVKKGAHLIQVRIMDAAKNIGTFSQEFTR